MKVRVFVACDELSPRLDADQVVIEIGTNGERFVSRYMSSRDAIDLCRRTKDMFKSTLGVTLLTHPDGREQ